MVKFENYRIAKYIRGVGTMGVRGHRPPQHFNWGGLAL